MSSHPIVLSCRIEAVSVICLLQTIETAQLTGTLTGRGATIDFADGVPVAARLGEHEGIDALLELFVWTEGALDFASTPVVGTPLAEPFAIQMEGCRVADEWLRLGDSCFAVREPGALPQAIEAALTAGAALKTAVARSGHLWAAQIDAIGSAIDAGAITRIAGPAKPLPEAPRHPAGANSVPTTPDEAHGVSVPEGSFDALLESGRTALRKRSFEEAVHAFEQALLLRPDDPVVAQNLRRTLEVRKRWSAT